MKKAEEYLEEAFKNNLTSPIYEIKDSKTIILKLIKQAQIDAIEEAVKRCAKKAELLYSIDKEKILKVAEQLRKEIE